MSVVVVTGAAGGIGLATVKALLAASFKVLGVDISAAPSEDLGANFHFLQSNITEATAPDAITQAAKDKFGKLDALINVAGVMDLLQSADTLDDKIWDRVISINLTAPVKLMGAAIKLFKQQGGGGAIANVGSYASISGGSAGVAYTASKHGLLGATKATAFRYKNEGIRCNAVLPGGVITGIMDTIDMTKLDMASGQVLAGVRNAAQPDNLILRPEAIASMLVYLVSDASEGVNGAAIPIDNGWSTI